MKRIMITRRIEYLAEAEQALAEQFELVHAPSTAESDLVAAARDAHAIVAITGVKVTEPVISSAPLLEAIATPAVGFDGIDVEAATRAGVPVISNVGVSPDSVAEFTLGLMIALTRRIVRADRDLRTTRAWSSRQRYFDPRGDLGVELSACTIGILGMGQIGAALGRMARAAFSATILGYDPFLTASQIAERGAEPVADLMQIAARSDFLLLHVPLSKDTRHLIGASVLQAMKPTAFLVNCSRGPVVDEAALVEALRAGRIGGAALDVFEKEPLDPTSPLFELDNVILTPHLAGVSVQSNERRAQALVERLRTVLAGERPPGLVNPEVWSRFADRQRSTAR